MIDPNTLPFKQGTATDEEVQKALQRIDEANAFRRKRVKGLKAGLVAKNSFMIGLNRYSLLNSPKCKLSAVIRANRRMKPSKRETLHRCLALPGAIVLGEKIEEPVRILVKPKKNGGHRVLLEFGLHHRAAQVMVTDVLSTYLVPRPFQFTFRGVHEAIKAAKATIAAVWCMPRNWTSATITAASNSRSSPQGYPSQLGG